MGVQCSRDPKRKSVKEEEVVGAIKKRKNRSAGPESSKGQRDPVPLDLPHRVARPYSSQTVSRGSRQGQFEPVPPDLPIWGCRPCSSQTISQGSRQERLQSTSNYSASTFAYDPRSEITRSHIQAVPNRTIWDIQNMEASSHGSVTSSVGDTRSKCDHSAPTAASKSTSDKSNLYSPRTWIPLISNNRNTQVDRSWLDSNAFLTDLDFWMLKMYMPKD